MRAVIMNSGGDVRVDTLPDPEPPAADGAVVKVDAAAICGSDLHFYDGDLPSVDGLSIGHEAVGTVVEVGDAVRTVSVGDRVMVSCIASCGHCRGCWAGDPATCDSGSTIFGFGAGLGGAQAELLAVPTADFILRKLPESIDDEAALLLTDNLATGWTAARDGDGGARAFVNVCAHRGAQVATGCGHATRFTCPYHAWSYDLTGRLATVPGRRMFDGVDLAELRLRPLPVSEQAGLIVVALDDAVAVTGFLDDARDDLASFGFERYAHAISADLPLRADWKLAVDVNFEGYHFPFLHRDTLAPIVTNNSVFDVYGAHCRWAFPFRNIEELRGVPEDRWPQRFPGSVVYGLFPSCVLVESPVSTLMLRIYPGETPGTCVVHMVGGALQPMVTEDDRLLAQAGFDGATAVLRDEDFPAAEACQRGVENGLENVVVGRSEPLVQHLHRHWDAALTS